MDLSGKWALVTGSSRGIGKEIALELAKRNCNVIVHGRTETNCNEVVKEIKALGVEVKAIGSAVDSDAGVQAIIDFVKAEIGTPDIIYNNAGIQNEWCDTFENSLDVWRTQFQVNLFSVVQICNALIPDMVKRGSGTVINTTSDIEGVPQMASYGSAKWAIRKMTEEFAVELNETGVKIFAHDPSWLKTDLGGDEAPNEVNTVVPGALAPLIEGLVENGAVFSSQQYRENSLLKR